MAYINTADAIIIDLRKNGGGGPLVNYLSSYFLPENTLLTSTYTRKTNHTENIVTTKVNGQQRLDVPLFILTSERTFSAAEAFSYSLQARKRAVIIGQSTGGGAHPVMFKRLPHGFGLMVPYARSINPITKTNWEAVGVTPDIIVDVEQALTRAQEEAKNAAKYYRELPFTTLERILEEDTISEVKLRAVLATLLSREHLEDFVINDLAYRYQSNGKSSAALALFSANVILFPDNPNTHDSYAEALALNQQKALAIAHYKKAVSIATEQGHRNLPMFKDHLNKYLENK